MVLDLESEILEKMNKRIVSSFMDVLILVQLRSGSMSGHDIIAFIHKKFHMLVSSGTVYSIVYSMERDGFIEGRWEQRKRVYTLTDKGEETVKAILNLKEKILGLMINFFM